MKKEKSVQMVNEISRKGELTWTLTKDGCLIVGGSGRMRDFSDTNPAPWAQEAECIRRVSIEAGVENIGGRAFVGCGNLKIVELGPDVRRVGWHAFYGCGCLSDVISCRQLQHWRLPESGEDSVVLVGHRAFCGTPWQQQGTDFVIHEDVLLEYLGTEQAVTVPDGVREIAPMAFEKKRLKEVTLPESLEVIGTCAFAGNGLKELELPVGLKTVDPFAFFGNPALNRVWKENRLTEIHPKAFQGTPLYDMQEHTYGQWLIAQPGEDAERFTEVARKRWTASQLRRLMKAGAVVLQLCPDPEKGTFYVTSYCYDFRGIMRRYTPCHYLAESGILGEREVEFSDLPNWRLRYENEDTWISIHSEEYGCLNKGEESFELEYLLRSIRKRNARVYYSWDRGNFYGPLEISLAEKWLDENEAYHL